MCVCMCVCERERERGLNLVLDGVHGHVHAHVALRRVLRHEPAARPLLNKLSSFFGISSLELSATKSYAAQIRALLGTASHFCGVVVLKLLTDRCRANVAHMRQSRPDSGLDFHFKVLKTVLVVPFSL